MSKEPDAAFVELELVVTLGRRAMFSREFTRRYRIRRVSGKVGPRSVASKPPVRPAR